MRTSHAALQQQKELVAGRHSLCKLACRLAAEEASSTTKLGADHTLACEAITVASLPCVKTTLRGRLPFSLGKAATCTGIRSACTCWQAVTCCHLAPWQWPCKHQCWQVITCWHLALRQWFAGHARISAGRLPR